MITFWCQVFIILCFHLTQFNFIQFQFSSSGYDYNINMISTVVFYNWKSAKGNYRYFWLWILMWLEMTFPDKRGNTYEPQDKSSWLPIFNTSFWLKFFLKKQRHYFANKGPSSQSCGFPSSHVWMWELEYKESWAQENWCFWTVCWRRLESLLDCKKIKPINLKGNQSSIFIGRTAAEAETPPDGKNWLTGNDPDAGKD